MRNNRVVFEICVLELQKELQFTGFMFFLLNIFFTGLQILECLYA